MSADGPAGRTRQAASRKNPGHKRKLFRPERKGAKFAFDHTLLLKKYSTAERAGTFKVQLSRIPQGTKRLRR